MEPAAAKAVAKTGETPAKAASETAKAPAKKKAAKPATAKKAKPAQPDDLTPLPVRHVAVCPPPKLAPCVMKRPVNSGYRVLTSGVDITDDGTDWTVDFGKGPKGSMFLLQVLELGGTLHEVEVKFRAKPGMQKTPVLQAE